MFTGLIEAVAPVVGIADHPQAVDSSRPSSGRSIEIRLPPDWSAVVGESIAVNGACLTVAALRGVHQAGRGEKQAEADEGLIASFDASFETLSKTNLGDLVVGHAVNLERALAIGSRLGGHLVSGHVDGIGMLSAQTKQGKDELSLELTVPPEFRELLIPKGSVALDGISLTVNDLRDRRDGTVISLWIIPTTIRHTTIGGWVEGQKINIEFDMLGKYILRSRQVGAFNGGRR